MDIINTGRLILRPFRADDTKDLYEYSKSPDVGPRAGWKPHESLEESEEILKTVFLNQENIWAITFADDDKVIGSIGLIKDPRREVDDVLMLGYALGDKYWNKGIMTEAAKAVVCYGFEKLHMNMLSCSHYPFNEASKKVMLKCGFEYEATIHHAEKMYDGKIHDHACYVLTKDRYDLVKKEY